MIDRALRDALEALAPDVAPDGDAVLAEVKPRFRRARRRRRLRLVVATALAGLVVAGALALVAVISDDPVGTPAPAAPIDSNPVDSNPPLTTGAPVPFTVEDAERG